MVFHFKYKNERYLLCMLQRMHICMLFLFFQILTKNLISCNSAVTREPPGFQIDPVIALLPWTPVELHEQRVHFTLHAYGGCFIWTSQKPHFVDVVPIFTDSDACSNVAIVSATSLLPQEGRSWVFAKDLATEVELRCEVHIAPLASIEIDTPTRSIGVDVLETISIRGLDRLGNVFSSLEGLWFDWISSDPSVLSFASLDTDVYRASAVRQQIQKKGGQADIVLLKGVSSGRSTVTAKISERAYKNVPSTSVNLDVSEPLLIEPNYMRVPPLATIQFALRILKPRISSIHCPLIPLPSPHFNWSSSLYSSRPLIRVAPSSGVVFVNSTVEGQDSVIVTDRRTSNNTAEAILEITPIKKLQMFATELYLNTTELTSWEHTLHKPFPNKSSSIRPLNSLTSEPIWYLIKNQKYFIGVEALSSKNTDIYIPSNMIFNVSCLSENKNEFVRIDFSKKKLFNHCQHFTIDSISISQRFLIIHPHQLGNGILRYSTELSKQSHVPKIPNDAIHPHILYEKKMIVVDPVRVLFQPIQNSTNRFKPVWPPVVFPVEHSWTFEAVGGSGSYVWSTTNATVVKIVQSRNLGTIRTQTVYGVAHIRVEDLKNIQNCYIFTIIVAPLGRLVIDPLRLQEPGETMIEIPVRALPLSLPLPLPKDSLSFTQMNEILDSLIHIKDNQAPIGIDTTMLPTYKNLINLTHFHFLNCSAIADTMKKTFEIIAVTFTGQQISNSRFIPTPLEHYICGKIILTSPKAAGLIHLTLSLNKQFNTTKAIEIYPDLSTLIESNTPWEPPIVSSISEWNPPSQATQQHSGDLIIAVGNWIDIIVTGGPSQIDGFQNQIDYTYEDYTISNLHLYQSQHPLTGSTVLRVTCLQMTPDVISTIHLSRHSIPPKEYPFHKLNYTANNNHYIQSMNTIDRYPSKFLLPYTLESVESHVSLNVRCEFPTVIEIHPYNIFPLPRPSWPLQRVITDHWHMTNDDDNISSRVHIKCYSTHYFGLFVYGKNGIRIPYWANAYQATWSFSTPRQTYVSTPQFQMNGDPWKQNITISPDNCFGKIGLDVSLTLKPEFLRTLLSTHQLKNQGILINNCVRHLNQLCNKNSRWIKHKSKYDTNMSLYDRLMLIPVSNHHMYPSLKNNLHLYPFFYVPNWSRRILIYSGSGEYTLRTNPVELSVRLISSHIQFESTTLPISGCSQQTQLTSLPMEHGLNDPQHQPLSSTDPINHTIHYADTCLDTYNPTEFSRQLIIDDALSDYHNQTLPRSFTMERPENYWDIILLPKEPINDFQVIVDDMKLLGQTEVIQRFSFTSIGSIQINLGNKLYRYPPSSLVPHSTNIALNQLQQSADIIYMEVNSIVEIEVQVYDSMHHLPFHPNEFLLMKLCLSVVSKHSDSHKYIRLSCLPTVLSTTKSLCHDDYSIELNQFWDHITESVSINGTISTNILFVQGLIAGDYDILAVGYNEQHQPIYSNILHLSIFNPLEIKPNQLILMPGGHSFEVEIIGGPTSFQESITSSITVTDHLGTVFQTTSNVIQLSQTQSHFPLIKTTHVQGIVTLRAKDTQSFLGLPSIAECTIRVALPKYVRILGISDNSQQRSSQKSLPLNNFQLKQYHSRTLIAGLFTTNDQLFTLPHLVNPSGLLTSQGNDIESIDVAYYFLDLKAYGTQTVSVNRCVYEWESDNPALIQFLMPDAIETTRTKPLTHHSIKGTGLISVTVINLGGMSGKGFIRLSCKCGKSIQTTTDDSQPIGTEKPVFSFQYELSIAYHIIPYPQLLMYQTFPYPLLGNLPSLYHSQQTLSSLIGPDQTILTRIPSVLWISPNSHYQLYFETTMALLDPIIRDSFGTTIVSNSTTFVPLKATIGCHGHCLDMTSYTFDMGIIHSTPSLVSYMLQIQSSEIEENYESLMINVPIIITTPCSLSISPVPLIIGSGSTIDIFMSLRDCKGNMMLFPLNARINILVSHPSIIQSVIPFDSYKEQTLFKKVIFKARKTGCVGVSIQVTMSSIDMSSKRLSKESSTLSASIRLCSDSALLPSSSPILLVPGGVSHFILDPERFITLPLITIKLNIWLRPTSVVSTIFNKEKCGTGIHEDFYSCDMTDFILHRRIPNLPIDCLKNRQHLRWGDIEQKMIQSLTLELRTILHQHIFSQISGWTLTPSESILFETVKEIISSQETACQQTRLRYSTLVTIQRQLLAGLINDYTSSIGVLLDKLWMTAVQSPPATILGHIDWSAGGITLEPLDDTVQWTTTIDHKIMDLHPIGKMTAKNIGTGTFFFNKNGHDITGSTVIEVISIKSLCSIIVHDTPTTPVTNHLIVLERYQNHQQCIELDEKKEFTDELFNKITTQLDQSLSSLYLSNFKTQSTLIVFIPYTRDHLNILRPIYSSAFIVQNIAVHCSIEHVQSSYLFTMKSVNVVLRSLSGHIVTTPACRLTPNRPSFTQIVQYPIPSLLKLIVTVKSTTLPTTMKQNYKFSWELMPAIIINDQTTTNFVSVSAFGRLLSSTAKLYPSTTTKAIILSRHTLYPMTFTVYTGGKHINVSVANTHSDTLITNLKILPLNTTAAVSIIWKEAVEWQERARQFDMSEHYDEVDPHIWWKAMKQLLSLGKITNKREKSVQQKMLSSKYHIQTKQEPAFNPMSPSVSYIILENEADRIIIPIIFSEISGISNDVTRLKNYTINNVLSQLKMMLSLFSIHGIGAAIAIVLATIILLSCLPRSIPLAREMKIPFEPVQATPQRRSIGTPGNHRSPYSTAERREFGIGGFAGRSPSPRLSGCRLPFNSFSSTTQ